MARAALLFNGIGFSFQVEERAFSWAKQNNGSLVALFLKAKHVAREGYIFPSDLDEAQNLQNNEDADAASMRVIYSNITMLEHNASSKHINLTTQLMSDPSEEQILQHISGCECLFMDDKFDQPGILRVEGTHLEKLLKKIQLPIVKVPV
ncbi:hypothetical protein [Terrimonas alba]|uniref:hypothetical protein n=1 Tax=Terrimonas alba TaxID=3349636 RepID=UPI0035F22895